MVLSGRAKKNWKSTDLVFAGFNRPLMWESPQGNDCLLLADNEDQAGDDLTLAKKLRASSGTKASSLVSKSSLLGVKPNTTRRP
jgi:hypothetical protein